MVVVVGGAAGAATSSAVIQNKYNNILLTSNKLGKDANRHAHAKTVWLHLLVRLHVSTS